MAGSTGEGRHVSLTLNTGNTHAEIHAFIDGKHLIMGASLRCAARATQHTIARSLLLLALCLTPANAAFITFDNCLDSSQLNSSPLRLQWQPLFFDARFDTTNSSYPLNVTLFGNVTGQQFEGQYPPPNSSVWTDPNNTFGKIAETGPDKKEYTTQFAKFDFLTYNAYTAPPSSFCQNDLVNGTCPLGPLFYANASDPSQLHAFTVGHDFYSSYAFSTLTATIRVVSGDMPPQDYACISANITPDLGNRIRALLTWLPAAILILKGIATLSAAIYSPWGSSDIFRWSSNYGRDEDLLRLVTPGFGDCLQYIQFILLTGSLTLQYPGFFQPAVRQTAWSCLLFNESFVSHGSGTESLIDGIYATNGTYGLETMSQLIGMTEVDDIWACMAIWLAVIAGCVILLCQLGFFSRWIHRKLTDTTEEDLRRKNLPFTFGNMIRLLFNYFILPIVALSFFQLVIAGSSPVSVVVMACVLLVIMIASAIWIIRFIFRTKPRTVLFDDMPTVLLYGPFYNTYSDSAAPFALVPVFITFIRGVAIGAVQPSGIAQIIILAICEVILILTLNGLRPFQGQTSMNLYHTIFSSVRLITVLLQIAFVPSLGVTEAPKGWIGYVILILHACVLVFGFFLNAAQTLLEVIARAFGVGGNSQNAVRGNILTSRMLKKRRTRPATADRQSLMSNAAMLRHTEEFDQSRSRSMSASSQQLLGRTAGTPSTHRLSGFENFSSNGEGGNAIDNDVESTAYFGAGGKPLSKKSTDISNATDNYYRPPRPRRGTNDILTPGAKSRESGANPDQPYTDVPTKSSKRVDSYDSAQFAARDSPAAAYFRDRGEEGEGAPRTDYAVREVDQYYRGPALSDAPTRKLKTGPADPQGPAASAQSWFQRIAAGFQGKNKQEKEKTKGFEVVRSTRMPPEMQQGGEAAEDFEMVNSPPMHAEPYRDSPPERHAEPQTVPGAERDFAHDGPMGGAQSAEPFEFDFNDSPVSAMSPEHKRNESYSTIPDLIGTHPALRPSFDSSKDQHPGMRAELPRRPSTSTPVPQYNVEQASRQLQHISEVPTLSPIESVGDINLPSRFNSQHSTSRADFGEGRDWLRAVDSMDWPDHARDNTLQPGPAPQAGPSVPSRSPRRPLSVSRGPDPNLSFPAFGNDVVSPVNPTATFDELAPPTNFAVSHKRAADSITRNSFGAHQVASAAEVFTDDEN